MCPYRCTVWVVWFLFSKGELNVGDYQRRGQSMVSTASFEQLVKRFREGSKTIPGLHDNADRIVSSEAQATNLKQISLKSAPKPTVPSGFVSLNHSTLFLLKKALRFHSDDEVKEAMQDFLENQTEKKYRPTDKTMIPVLQRQKRFILNYTIKV
ncbi:hypothetical protein TNCV_1297191 [Trichonephila clavipes]|nr:hypothetical protein TNCV_1297191 [Trichonephila clavipes]